MERIFEFFNTGDRFAGLVGVELLDIAPGYAKAALDVGETHLNAFDAPHGAVFTLADFVFAAAGNSHGLAAMAINVDVSYLKTVRAGARLVAEARELSANPRLASYEVTVSEDSGDPVAVFQSMAYRKKDPLPI
jgi:acyl-CoA thioesterase